MSFLETVERARAFLERNGRVSLSAFQRAFDLDDDALRELVEELAGTRGRTIRTLLGMIGSPNSIADGGAAVTGS